MRTRIMGEVSVCARVRTRIMGEVSVCARVRFDMSTSWVMFLFQIWGHVGAKKGLDRA